LRELLDPPKEDLSRGSFACCNWGMKVGAFGASQVGPPG